MEKLWVLAESIIKFVLVKILHLKITDQNWDKLCQVIKFGMVGVSNTIISYIVYILLVTIDVHYLAASLFSFLVSVINAYYWNDKYVFKANNCEQRIWWHSFLKTFMSYAGTGLVLNNILLILWIDIFKINEALGPLINLFITIPLNYLLNKYWAFKGKSK
jgi:putative flippase GtrA